MSKTSAIIKRDTLEHWQMAQNYIPNEGIIVIIDMPDNSVQLKLGDGQTKVNDLVNLLENKNNIPSYGYKDEILEF